MESVKKLVRPTVGRFFLNFLFSTMRLLVNVWIFIAFIPLVSFSQGSSQDNMPIPDPTDVCNIFRLLSPIEIDGMPFEEGSNSEVILDGST